MPNRAIIAWDSSVILDALDPDSEWHKEILPMYTEAQIGKVDILVSEISIAEVCKLTGMVSAGKLTAEAAVQLINSFFNNKFIIRRAADRRESMLAAEIMRTHNLETCDALIVATAAIHNARVLYTRDGKKRRKTQPSPLKCDGLIGQPSLPIKEPNAALFAGQPLFAPRGPDANS